MEKPHSVLLVADTQNDCEAVARVLNAEHQFLMLGPVGAVEALRLWSTTTPTVAVVHATLQDITGPELCSLLRGRSARQELCCVLFDQGETLDDQIPTLKACAHVSAPDPSDLAQRVASLVRGAIDQESGAQVDEYRGRHLVAHFTRVSVSVDGERVDLTRQELALLQFLVAHRNRVLTRPDILSHVWPKSGPSRTVDTHIRRLRIKLGPAGDQIQTIPRIGYRFNEP